MSLDALQAKMDSIDRKTKFGIIMRLIEHEAKRCDSDEFRAFIVGLLGSVMNGMTEEVFKQFTAVHKCSEPNCDCHVIAAAATEFFTLLRTDVKKELARRNIAKN